jgi:radical SAM protein with 4Fe4S-binding SPASM domain
MMVTLSPAAVIRPEPGGALLFQRETAETALLDLEGLDALYFLLALTPRLSPENGRRVGGEGQSRATRRARDYPVFFANYLRQRGFIIPGRPDGALAVVEAVRDAAPTTTAPPHSLSVPETIHFSVTGCCDQACAGCFYSARPPGAGPQGLAGSDITATYAPFPLFEQVVRQAEQARVFQIALGGGEPLLHPQLVEMVRLAHAHTLVPNLTTNGNRLTRELALALKEAGLGQVQISLNGADEATNARTRPNFAAALRALEICRDAGLRFGLNFLLTRSSLPGLADVVELGRRLDAESVNLLRPKPPVTDDGWLARESPGPEDYRRVKRILRELWGKTGGTRITLDASLTFLLTDTPPDRLYRAGVWGCCAARKFVTVLQDGRVLPCSHVRQSDVGGGDFVRAWRESCLFARFRSLEETMRGPCRACAALSVCRGCPAVVMAFGGEMGDSDPHCPWGKAD